MTNGRWIAFVSKRWFVARRESGGTASSVLASAGIGVGVAALIIVLGVMNGFQLGYIESILEISSFHARVEARSAGPFDSEFARELSSIPGVRSVLPFWETHALLTASDGRVQPIKLRALPEDLASRDFRFIEALGLIGPKLHPSSELFGRNDTIVLGTEMANWLNVAVGDEVKLLVIGSSEDEGVSTSTKRFLVSRVFRSGYFDFDFGLGLVSFDSARSLLPESSTISYTYGIKLNDRFEDSSFALNAEKLSSAHRLTKISIETWRDYNRSFFGALRTEKTAMMLLVGLIFAVVGVNIFHSMRRSVAERMEDIAVLRAVGCPAADIRRAFIYQGIAIGAFGSIAGLASGLLIAVNVNQVFAIFEALVNGAQFIFSYLPGVSGNEFRVFSPRYFYLMEVPVRVLFPETLFIVAAATASAAIAAGAAATRSSTLAPAEALRYE